MPDTTARALALAAANVHQPVRPPLRRRHGPLVSSFQAGHGWTVHGAHRSLPDDRDHNVVGTQCLSLTTDASGSVAKVEKVGLRLDVRRHNVRMLAEIDRLEDVGSFVLTFRSGGSWDAAGVRDLTGPPNLGVGGAQWFTFGMEFLKAAPGFDASAVDGVRVSIRSRPGSSITLRLHALELVPDTRDRYPRGVVTFTVDDGEADQCTRLKPILDRYLFPATAYIITHEITRWPGFYLSLPQLQELQHASGWEIAAHATTVASHNATFAGRTEDDLAAEFSAIKRWLLGNGFHGGDHLAWPLNAFDATALAVAGRYFVTARTTIGDGRFHNALPPEPHLHMTGVNLGLGLSLESAMINVDACVEAGSWLVFVGHGLADRSVDGSTWSDANFAALVDYVASKDVPVRTIGDVVATL